MHTYPGQIDSIDYEAHKHNQFSPAFQKQKQGRMKSGLPERVSLSVGQKAGLDNQVKVYGNLIGYPDKTHHWRGDVDVKI